MRPPLRLRRGPGVLPPSSVSGAPSPLPLLTPDVVGSRRGGVGSPHTLSTRTSTLTHSALSGRGGGGDDADGRGKLYALRVLVVLIGVLLPTVVMSLTSPSDPDPSLEWTGSGGSPGRSKTSLTQPCRVSSRDLEPRTLPTVRGRVRTDVKNRETRERQ